MTYKSTDPWEIAFDAAFDAIVRTRAAGSFDNTMVIHAVITSGISVAEFRDVGRAAMIAAFESYAERKRIIAAIGEHL